MAQIITANGAAPATPAAGNTTLYSKSDKTMAYKDDAGIEHVLVEVSSGAANIPSNMNFAGVGARILGDFSNATITNRTMFQTSTVNANTAVSLIPNGTGQATSIKLYGTQDPVNSPFVDLFCNSPSGEASMRASASGTGAFVPLTFYTGNAERLRIDTSGNVLVTGSGGLGYGTGSGGTVTQLTSKSTAVTLNKPSGQITMNNAALAAGGSVVFTWSNSLMTASDNAICTVSGGAADRTAYRADIYPGNTGAQIKITNTSAGSLSEAIVLTVTLTKGATA